MNIINFLICKRQLPYFPICLNRHRYELRRGSYHFLVYHRFQSNGSFILHSALILTFTETPGETVRPLGIMLGCSVFSPGVSGIYSFRRLRYNSPYRLNSLPRVPLPRKGMYDCSVRRLVLNIQNTNELCPNSRKAKTEFTRMGFI
jgi:hypothetical protein